jgi:hypothetical protein
VLQFVAEDLTQFEERAGEWRRSFLSALVASVDSVFPFLVKVGGGLGLGIWVARFRCLGWAWAWFGVAMSMPVFLAAPWTIPASSLALPRLLACSYCRTASQQASPPRRRPAAGPLTPRARTPRW